MFSIAVKILILGIIVSTIAFTNTVSSITEFVTNFNSNVIAFLPSELFLFVYVIAFILMLKLYQSMH